MNTILIVLGALLVAGGLLQMAFWTATNFRIAKGYKQQLQLHQDFLRDRLEALSQSKQVQGDVDHRWVGFRRFVVKRLVKETEHSTSVYLYPKDQKPISSFYPGQYLTIQVQVPGQTKPVVRCYSLSDGPNSECYRITVKTVPPPRDRPELGEGKVSSYINKILTVGEEIEAKNPSGDFYLEVQGQRPVVLLAAGVGITPMMSMVETLLNMGSKREILLLYGSRHGQDHIFKERLAQLSMQNQNLSVLNCYSEPNPEDRSGEDYQVKGWVSVDLLKKVLPSSNYHYYMCGPPPFIASLHDGLTEWGVPETNIHLEAFGPASVKKKKKDSDVNTNSAASVKVEFSKSGTTVDWNGDHDNLLDAGEDAGLDLDSGCRAGSCGTCEVRLAKGAVSYPDGEPDGMEAGMCFPCVAKPTSDVTLDA